MADLSAFPNRLDRKKCECCAIIETPRNRRNKFDYDPESNLFKLGGLLPEGMMFFFDVGFIPSTLVGDGDPLTLSSIEQLNPSISGGEHRDGRHRHQYQSDPPQRSLGSGTNPATHDLGIARE